MLSMEVLDEFRLGMIEANAKAALPKMKNHPYLDRPHVTLQQFDARRAARQVQQ